MKGLVGQANEPGAAPRGSRDHRGFPSWKTTGSDLCGRKASQEGDGVLLGPGVQDRESHGA